MYVFVAAFGLMMMMMLGWLSSTSVSLVLQRLVEVAEAAHKNHEYDKDIQVRFYLIPFARPTCCKMGQQNEI